MSKLSTRPAFSGTEIQDTDEFWINVDNLDTTFTSQKITGLQLKDLLTGDSSVQTVVLFDKNTPTTAGVVFTPDTPLTTGVLYISTTNNSTWKYNGTSYVTYAVPVTATTPFSLSANTSIDAGGNKTASITRSGNINVGISTEYVNISSSTGVHHISNSYSQIQATTYSDTLYPIIQTGRRRGTIASNSYVINGDILGAVSLSGGAYVTAKSTETHSAIARGTELIFSNCANGSTSQSENMKIQQDGIVLFSNGIDAKARVQSVTSSATVTPTSSNDLVTITAQAVGLTLANPTGTFTEGQALMIRIKDNGTARTIAFDTNYRAIGFTLPTTTVASKTMYVGIIYNATDSKWDILGAPTQE